MKCLICGNEKENSCFMVKEMQQGLREEFEYVECSNCGCLFIKDIPSNMDKYYDNNYAPHKNQTTIKNKIKDKIYAMYLDDNKVIKLIKGNNVSITTKFWNNLISSGAMRKNSSILDIGCGDGNFLDILKKAGFKDLTGMDLFIDEENMIGGITIYQSSLEDFKPNRKYDIIISNHAVEHMDKQLESFKCFENLVKDDGMIIIRIPIKSKPIWEKYGVNWYQLDAPRNFFLHTIESIKILCSKTNLVIEDIIFDSYDNLFINCEKYSKNLSPRDAEWNTFKLDQMVIDELQNEIRRLNKNNEETKLFLY